MDDLNARQQKHLEFLLADFAAIKGEIARRSGLQRTVLLAQVGVLAVVIQWMIGEPMSLSWLKVTGMWLISALSSGYYAREHMEIMRLGMIVRDRIATTAGGLIGVGPGALLPSETNPEQPETRSTRARYNREFNWTIFLVVPLLVTTGFLLNRSSEIGSQPRLGSSDFWALVLVVALALRTFLLVRRGT